MENLVFLLIKFCHSNLKSNMVIYGYTIKKSSNFRVTGRYMYHPLLSVSNNKDDPAVYGDFAMLERSSPAKRVRDSMMRYLTSKWFQM